jgi:hypothetical protein
MWTHGATSEVSVAPPEPIDDPPEGDRCDLESPDVELPVWVTDHAGAVFYVGLYRSIGFLERHYSLSRD